MKAGKLVYFSLQTYALSSCKTHANNEEEIYYYMKAKFDLLTNDGESYDPEIHDSIVSNAASLQFGITPSEATSIYIRYEMR